MAEALPLRALQDPFEGPSYVESFALVERLWDVLTWALVVNRITDDEWDLIWDLLAVDQWERLLHGRRQAYEDGYYAGRVEGVHLGLAAVRSA